MKPMTVKAPKQLFSYTGGKTRYWKHILPQLAVQPGQTYVEPFLGAGSVFAALVRSGWTGRAILNDANPELMRLYRSIKTEPQAVIDEATHLQQDRSRIWLTTKSGDRLKEHFYRVRDSYALLPSAGKLLFLAKTCFNGMWAPCGGSKYSDGRKGKSCSTIKIPELAADNEQRTQDRLRLVPELSSDGHGTDRYTNFSGQPYNIPTIIDTIEQAVLTYNAIGQPDNVMAWHRALQSADLSSGDFQQLAIPAGSVVYCDPPYLGCSVDYAAENSEQFQSRLVGWCREQAERGCTVVMTNKDRDGFFGRVAPAAEQLGYEAKHNTKWNLKAEERKVRELMLVWRGK